MDIEASIAVFLAGWLWMRWVVAMYGWVRGFMAPFYVLWWVVETLWGFGVWSRGKYKDWTRRPVYGASWAKPRDIIKGGGGFVVGKIGKRTVSVSEEAHVVMAGKTGSGKSQVMGATLNVLERLDYNCLVNDPKGEHASRHGERLKAAGYRVITVNIDNPMEGEPWNPLSYLRASTRYSEKHDLRTLMGLLSGKVSERDGTNKYFHDSAMRLGAAFCAYVAETGTVYDAAMLLGKNGISGAEVACHDILRAGVSDESRLALQQFLNAGERGEKSGIFNSTVDLMEDWVSERGKDLCRDTT